MPVQVHELPAPAIYEIEDFGLHLLKYCTQDSKLSIHGLLSLKVHLSELRFSSLRWNIHLLILFRFCMNQLFFCSRACIACNAFIMLKGGWSLNVILSGFSVGVGVCIAPPCLHYITWTVELAFSKLAGPALELI